MCKVLLLCILFSFSLSAKEAQQSAVPAKRSPEMAKSLLRGISELTTREMDQMNNFLIKLRRLLKDEELLKEEAEFKAKQEQALP